MPNWCSNHLTVFGDDAKLKEFMSFTEEKQTHESIYKPMRLHPTPEGVDWYNWNVENWGTKWEVDMMSYGHEGDRAEFHFDSAWSPPCELFNVISAKYPTLSFILSYEELGIGFVGVSSWSKGKQQFDKCIDICEDERWKKIEREADEKGEDRWDELLELVSEVRDELDEQAYLYSV